MNTPQRLLLATSALCALLTGCADWQHLWYQGSTDHAQSCAARVRASDPPCVDIPEYSRYRREVRATTETKTPEPRNTITEVQAP